MSLCPFLTKKTEGPDASMKERRGVREGEGLKMIKLRREEKDKEKKAYCLEGPEKKPKTTKHQNSGKTGDSQIKILATYLKTTIKTRDLQFLPNGHLSLPVAHLRRNLHFNHQNSRSSISPKWPLKPLSSSSYTITEIMFGWPSGLRRQFKALVYS